MLTSGWLVPAADIIQGLTHDLLRAAVEQGEDRIVTSLLDLWSKPLRTVAPRDRLMVHYLLPGVRLSEAKLEQSADMWIGPDGSESVLYSAMYLAGATDIAAAIARRASASRPKEWDAFARQVNKLAVSHYKRWAFGPPNIWQVRGWGCGASGLDLVAFTRKRMDRSLGNGFMSFCHAPTDIDMLIAIGIANLFAVETADRELVSLSEEDRARLLDLLKLQSRFMLSRISYGSIRDSRGQTIETADFDPGTWTLHPDFIYAGTESPEFPVLPSGSNSNVSWDFSHGARIAWMALTFQQSPSLAGDTADWSRFTTAFAHQLGRRTLDDGGAVPLFRNFIDGRNGWYRVNPIAGTGVAPYGLSRAYLSMPWARLALRDEKLEAATNVLWRALALPTQAQCSSLDKNFVANSSWQDRKPAGVPISGPYYGMNILPFLAAAPVR